MAREIVESNNNTSIPTNNLATEKKKSTPIVANRVVGLNSSKKLEETYKEKYKLLESEYKEKLNNLEISYKEKLERKDSELSLIKDENKNLKSDNSSLKKELNNKPKSKKIIVEKEKIVEKVVYPEELENIRSSNKIKYFSDGIKLIEYGLNNTQIFTRKKDIDKMIDSIDRSFIENRTTTILEPTSGDRCFYN